MRAIDVSSADEMVVDRDGTLWVFKPSSESWGYINDESQFGYDFYKHLPESLEPYQALDSGAIYLVRKGLKG